MHVTVTAKGMKLQADPPMPEAEISFKVTFSILPQTGVVGCVIVTILRFWKSKSSSVVIYNLFLVTVNVHRDDVGRDSVSFLTPLPGTGQSC